MPLSQAPTQKKQKSSGAFGATGLEAAFDEFDAAQATSGTIMKIELINFKNHAHLAVDLKPGVNFVFGKNGSGKSALLEGCMVALGSKASTVKSGTRLSSYIQSGKNTATVKLWLYNGGADRYMPDSFGPQILIERVIDNKSNRHIAKAADGSVIATKASEIGEICDHFNINVANPCVVLTQDKAKHFLGSTDACVRYKFFMEATGLDVTRDNILAMLDEIDRMGLEMERFDGDQEKLKGTVAAKKKDWEQATALARYEGEIASLERKLKFVHAAAAQAELDAARAKVDEHTANYAQAESKLQRNRDAAGAAEAAHTEAEARTSNVGNQVSSIIAQINTLKDEHAAADKARSSAKMKSELAESRALKLREESKSLLARAKQQQLSFEKRQLDAEKKRDARRLALKEKQAQVAELLKQLESAEEQLFSEHSSLPTRAAEERGQEDILTRGLNTLQSQHKALSQASGPEQRLTLLDSGKPLAKWVQLIEANAHRFSAKPIGPIGMYVSITDAKFQLAIEGCLGNLLTSFVLTSHKDRLEFEMLLSQARLPFPDIITKQFEDRELPIPDSALPDRLRFRLMLDAVKFSHPMTQHAIVDRAGIERHVLIESDEEGAAILFVPGGTRNVTKAWLPNCYSMYKKGHTEATDRPPIGSGKKRTGVDTRAELLQIMAEIAEKKNALVVQKRHSAALNSSAANFDRTTKDFTSKRKQLQNDGRQVQGDLERLNQEGGQEEQTVQLAQDDANEKNAQAERLLRQAEELRAEMREAEVKVAHYAQRINELKAESTEIVNRSKADSEAVHELNIKAKKAKQALANNSKALGDFERARGVAKAAASALEGAANRLQQEALAGLAAGEEQPDIGCLTEGAINQQIKRKQDDIAQFQKQQSKTSGGNANRRGSAPITANEICALETSYKQLDEELQALKHMEENVRVGEEASGHFDYEMRLRQLSGSLEFDHLEDDGDKTTSTLKLSVQTNSQDASSKRTQNVQTLSGGERSFTTMAFQVAMWKFMMVPFRCMDEFDVFMDDVYRRQAIKTLLDTCDGQASSQFLFLTPQDMSSMLDGDTRKRHIFKMPDPRVD
ncbi:P-loop containing nucleoside triphosphate hydrolase protein [Pavlovales sp. CCMP2436]|nr:P-loop containing nucleoside triphosphate hydrolase protein [Pavlovales sp. CCMP2436]